MNHLNIVNFVNLQKIVMMKNGFLLSSVLIVLAAFQTAAQGPEVLIPAPAEVTINEGAYTFGEEPQITFVRRPQGDMPEESYILSVNARKGVTITYSDASGQYYALRTLDQMTADGTIRELQCCDIYDYPRFPYRGLHVDVSRHFRSIDFLKKQIDAMAMFKMNRMHIHLTDAAGWRMQIDAYPLLTGLAAWRPERLWKDWWSGDRRYVPEGTPEAYGGYYTKEQMRELVDYAAQRHIEVIPEIEMPGHSEEVIAAYPHLGCAGEAYRQGEFCIGNEDVFRFVETVLDEVMEVFPSEYVHIGGDEADKRHWKTCPKCQQRMREEGLKDVDELQSYMIRRISRYVESKGRKIIGWDEIIDGGLAEGATVMSWRGTEGGIAAMEMGHDVIMTPGRYCYLDHTQDAPFKEPESIGGYLPLDTVYVYDPLEPSMPLDKKHHLLGVQANLWSEYIPDDEHAEYMYWPRAMAVAETGWSLTENKDLMDFRRRAVLASDRMRSLGYNVFDLENEYGERKLSRMLAQHKAKGCKVIYNKPIQQWYPASGETTFTDGIMGGWTYSDGKWQGFLTDIDVTIDLGSVTPVHYVGGSFMQLKGPGVFMPEKVEIQISSDGVTFTPLAEVWNDVSTEIPDLLFRSFDTVCDVSTRYVRFCARRSTMRGFLFLDEIIVN
ncbi:MAG: family 20 glycosylhydrolase [Bacteroidales bacterium]|nr:family 20 glycosylhydrolase [Bacteroidales bacterium]